MLKQGSPHKLGASNMLVEQFQTVAHAKIGRCLMALLVAENNPNFHIIDCIVANHLPIVNFIGVQNIGLVLLIGCGTPEAS